MPLVIGGKVAEGPKKKLLVIPRDTGDFDFHFVAVIDDDAFDSIMPPPIPPRTFVTKLQRTVDNVEDENYKRQVQDRLSIRQDWIFLKSIEPSSIKWEQVRFEDPSTYFFWRKELKDAGFSINEVNTIWNTFLECNVLSESMLDEARNRFLACQAEAKSQKPQ